MNAWQRSRRQGISLAELLVAMFIGSLLITAVLLAFVSTGRTLTWVSTRSDLGSSAMLGLSRLSQELRSSSLATVTISTTDIPGACIQFEIQDPNDTDPLSQSFSAAPYAVVYYFTGSNASLCAPLPANALVRKIWPAPGQAAAAPTPPASGSRMLAGDIQTILSTINGSEHVEATGVQGVTFNPASYPPTIVPFTAVNSIGVTLQIQKAVNSSENVQQSVTTTVVPRNTQ